MASTTKNILDTIDSIQKHTNSNIGKKSLSSKKSPKEPTRANAQSKIEPKATSNSSVLAKAVRFPIWLSVSESAKLGGVTTKTVRRAIQSRKLKYKIVKGRYTVEFTSFVQYLYSKTKLRNKLKFHGLGQYINKWRE